MEKKEIYRWLASEPYRVFFPSALLAGIIGVALWPMFYSGHLSFYPSFAHARLMIEGFVGGVGLITMIVATRVIFGHSGQGHQFNRWNKALVICAGLLLLGMATRVSADFLPRVRNSHHVYAAICWVAVSIIWGIAIYPRCADDPPPVQVNLSLTDFPRCRRPPLITLILN